MDAVLLFVKIWSLKLVYSFLHKVTLLMIIDEHVFDASRDWAKDSYLEKCTSCIEKVTIYTIEISPSLPCSLSWTFVIHSTRTFLRASGMCCMNIQFHHHRTQVVHYHVHTKKKSMQVCVLNAMLVMHMPFSFDVVLSRLWHSHIRWFIIRILF